jgi:hypothetical protein
MASDDLEDLAESRYCCSHPQTWHESANSFRFNRRVFQHNLPEGDIDNSMQMRDANSGFADADAPC